MFQEKVFKFVHAQFWFFAVFFEVQCISIFKRKKNFFIEQQKVKGHEKRDRLLISKMETNYQISQRNKIFTYWSNFLKLG